MEEEFKIIGNRIKDMRKARNITQRQLADALNISITNMCNIENGRTAVTMQNLIKLKGVFSCELKDFFEEEQELKQKEQKLEEMQTRDAEVDVAESKKTAQQDEVRLPESIDLQDAINLLRLLRRIDIKGI